jgi:hypothetical protein
MIVKFDWISVDCVFCFVITSEEESFVRMFEGYQLSFHEHEGFRAFVSLFLTQPFRDGGTFTQTFASNADHGMKMFRVVPWSQFTAALCYAVPDWVNLKFSDSQKKASIALFLQESGSIHTNYS